MSVGDWFEKFCDNIKVQNKQSISDRYKAITRRLNSDFWNSSSEISNSLYVGSYGRNTAIYGFSDLDIVFTLPYDLYVRYNKHYGNGQSALLQAVKRSIERTYSTTNLRGDGQVIQVPFTDSLTFEVVPVFINNNNSYTYPDANNGGCWRTTNPKPEMAAIRTRNDACNKNLVWLCRMMRAWKRKWSVPIGGLLIDTLAYQFLEYYEYRKKSFVYYDWLCRDFFNFMANQADNKDYWKAPGSGQHVYKKGYFQWKARRCCNLAIEACRHETAEPKREWSAKQKWREVFGASFPS